MTLKPFLDENGIDMAIDEAAVVQAARHRQAQQAFLARGRASLTHAKKTQEFYPVHAVLDDMQARLDDQLRLRRRKLPAAPGKS